MYCSLECQEKDYAHQLKFCSVLYCNAFASITMALNSLGIAEGVNELIDLLSDTQFRTAFDFDHSNPHDSAYEKNLLVAVNSLKKKAWNESYEMDGHNLMKLLLSKETEETPKTPEEKALLQKCLTEQARITINFYGLGYCDSLNDTARQVGAGLFPLMSLLNHSCDQNVDNIFVDGKMVFVVFRPIKAGEQIFKTYCTDFKKLSRFERQQILKNDCNFICDCNACINDYPTIFHSQRKDPDFLPARTADSSPQEFIETFKKDCEYIEKNIKNHPSFEISSSMLRCESILCGLSAAIL